MKFDWYAATLPGAEPMTVVETLRREFGGRVEEGRRRLGYAQCFRLVSLGGHAQAEVLVGAVKGKLDPHAVATGEQAADFAGMLREHFPAHRVTRFDAAEDFDEPGAFARLTNTMGDIGAAKGLSGLWITPDDPEEGATYYLGSTSSSVRARAYQKGLQVRKEVHPALRPQISEHWARLEVQVRPPKEGRDIAARCSPEEAWGFAAWSTELAREALALEIAKVQGLGWKGQTDDEHAFDWMLRQYGGLLERIKGDLGDWSCVGLQIGQRLQELQKAAEQ